jgi:hypothetical protein
MGGFDAFSKQIRRMFSADLNYRHLPKICTKYAAIAKDGNKSVGAPIIYLAPSVPPALDAATERSPCRAIAEFGADESGAINVASYEGGGSLAFA